MTSWRAPRRTREVNGIRMTAKVSMDARKPRNSSTTPDELAQLERLGRAEPVEAVRDGRHQRAQRDEERGRHPAVELPREQRPDGARQRDHEVHADGDRRQDEVEQELLARLVRVERVLQDPALGHEHPRREQGAQDERERAGDVHERRQQPQLAGQDGACRGRPWPGSTEYPGAGRVVPTMSTIDRTVAPTTASAASRGQRQSWK